MLKPLLSCFSLSKGRFKSLLMERQVLYFANVTLDLSRIYAAPITRLGRLAFEGQGAFAPQS